MSDIAVHGTQVRLLVLVAGEVTRVVGIKRLVVLLKLVRVVPTALKLLGRWYGLVVALPAVDAGPLVWLEYELYIIVLAPTNGV